MKEPKTIRGYIQMMRRIELMNPTFMDGFEDLHEETQGNLKELSGSISNLINDIPEFKTLTTNKRKA